MSANPFPGPRPYSANERARFFARDAVVKKLANQILARRATTLFGPSGAGKSSLMQAGVIPTLQEAQDARVVSIDAWPVQTPPLQWLVNQIYLDYELGEVSEGKTLLEALQNGIDLAWRQNDCPMLMVLDQVEQLFVNERDAAEVEHLVEALSWLIDPERTEDVHVVLSLREDYLGRLRDVTREWPELSMHGFRVAPLSVGEMVLAMCRTAKEGEPAQEWNRQHIRALMLDVRVPGQRSTDAAEVQTAFGQIVCRALWEERAAGREMRGEDAEAILRRYLDTALAELGSLQGLAQQLLEEHLIDDEGHRRLLTEKEARQLLGGAIEVLERLDAARVLRAEEHQGSRYFELGHDWLAKKVLERRVERKARAARRRLIVFAAGALCVAVIYAVLGVLALVQRNAAQKAEAAAKEAREQAEENAKAARIAQADVKASIKMTNARVILDEGYFLQAAMIVSTLPNAERAPGWIEVAGNILEKTLYTSTLRGTSSGEWSPSGKHLFTITDSTVYVWNATGKGDPIVFHGHERTVYAAAWSPDGTRIVTASDDTTARVWNVNEPNRRIILRGHEGAVWSAGWSADGTRIVTASDDGTARVWNADGTGEPLVLEGHELAVYTAEWSPDGKYIATASRDGTARVWALDSLNTPYVFDIHPKNDVYFASWSPDGTQIMTASTDKTVRIWDATETNPPVVFPRFDNWVHSGKWSPDGTHVATLSWDTTARIWNTQGKGEPIVLKGHTETVKALAWSPDGTRIVTGSMDGTARIWQASGSGEPFVLKGNRGAVNSVAWSPDQKKIVTTSSDGRALVWSSERAQRDVILQGYRYLAAANRWSADGKHIIGKSKERDLRVWDVDAEGVRERVLVDARTAYLESFYPSPNGKQIAVVLDHGRIKILNIDGSGHATLFEGHEKGIEELSWSPTSERIVTISTDGTVRVLNIEDARREIVLKSGDADMQSVRFIGWSPDGQHIVALSDANVASVWNVNHPDRPRFTRKEVHAAAWQPTSRHIAFATYDLNSHSYNYLCDLEGGDAGTVHIYGNHPVWSSDGSSIATISDDDLVFADFDASREPRRFHIAKDSRPEHIEWSPTSPQVLIEYTDRALALAKTDGTGELLTAHKEAAISADWSPDGTRILAVSNTGEMLWIWDANSGTKLATLKTADKAEVITSAAWSPDGKRILVVTNDGRARIWVVDIPLLREALDNKTTDCLSPAQRQIYLLENESDARTRYEQCERRFDRTPLLNP